MAVSDLSVLVATKDSSADTLNACVCWSCVALAFRALDSPNAACNADVSSLLIFAVSSTAVEARACSASNCATKLTLFAVNFVTCSPRLSVSSDRALFLAISCCAASLRRKFSFIAIVNSRALRSSSFAACCCLSSSWAAAFISSSNERTGRLSFGGALSTNSSCSSTSSS